jgi:hypothetical protein
MKKYSYTELEAKFAELGYQWPTLHIVGVRSAANEKNKFDDHYLLDQWSNDACIYRNN